MNRNLEFLYEMASLRFVNRGWVQHLSGAGAASVLEHIFRVLWSALILARKYQSNHPEVSIDELKLLRMAMVHDLSETRVSDLSYVQKVYVEADENRAMKDLFAETLLIDYIKTYQDYESRESIESRLVRDADNLDIDLELKELAESGNKFPEECTITRKKIRDEKFYTQEAKELWDEVQTSNPNSWHLLSNKYYKLPDAGK